MKGIFVNDNLDKLLLHAEKYQLVIMKQGFRYAIRGIDGELKAGAHPVSGIRLSKPGGGELYDVAHAELQGIDEEKRLVTIRAVTKPGIAAEIRIELQPTMIRFSVVPEQEGLYTIEARTDSLQPVYGLGDFGAHINTVPTEDAPVAGKLDIPARDTADLFGLVRDDLMNQGTNMRFISTFAIFPKQGLAQVLFEEGSKRIAFTREENKLGVSKSRSIRDLVYFVGSMRTIYADYKAERERAGYPDRKPKYTMFRVGWEAYGSLGWNSYQSAVQEAITQYQERGYELAWGVVGSGFWKGDRKRVEQGNTESFNIWDDTYEEGRTDGLPNPRYPDPDGLKHFFAQRGVKLMIGIRHHWKAYMEDGGYHHPVYNGPFMEEGKQRGYFLKDSNGQPLRITNAEFPKGTLYVLDSRNAEALQWFIEHAQSWGADGFKEDAMVYTKHHADGNWNPINEAFMDRGYLTIVRNSAYSAPGDVIRINDTYYGKGEGFHFDQDRVPINLLNYAASGPSNLYPDITGGTPTTDPTLPSYQLYFVRNAMFNAMCPAMSMGRRPWEMKRPEFENAVKKAADWHNRYAPYIYSAVLDGYASGYPAAMTPLHIAYPEDPTVHGLVNRHTRQYEWLIGTSMLVAPLYGNDFETAECRDVYLPQGEWQDYETGQCFQGPQLLSNYPIPIGKIPVFIGGSGIIVRQEKGDDILYADIYMVSNDVTAEYIFTYPNGRSQSTIRKHKNTLECESNVYLVRNKATGAMVSTTYDNDLRITSFRIEQDVDYELSLV